MNWGEFIKPTLKKIIVFIVLAVLAFVWYLGSKAGIPNLGLAGTVIGAVTAAINIPFLLLLLGRFLRAFDDVSLFVLTLVYDYVLVCVAARLWRLSDFRPSRIKTPVSLAAGLVVAIYITFFSFCFDIGTCPASDMLPSALIFGISVFALIYLIWSFAGYAIRSYGKANLRRSNSP